MSGVPEVVSADPDGDYFKRMDAIRERDGAGLVSVELESRTTSPSVPDCGVVASETFVFALRFRSVVDYTVRLTIRVTADLALALAEELPEEADTLVAAWTELTTIADQLNERACRGGLEAERARRAEAAGKQ